MARLSTAQLTVLKLALIFVLGVAVWIPTLMIGFLVEERANRRDEACREVSATWGGAQTVQGPVLVIPVDTVSTTTVDGKRRSTTCRRHAFVLPEALEIDGDMSAELRNRSIYEVMLHRSSIRLQGHFNIVELPSLLDETAVVNWHQAMLAFGVSDLRGLAEIPSVSFAGGTVAVSPQSVGGPFGNGLAAVVPLAPSELSAASALPFSIELEVKGSGALSLLPLGSMTTATLRSPWTNPSFSGACLPTERSLGDTGFAATWKVLSLNREYPQQWLGSSRTSDEELLRVINNSAFSAELLFPVDSYQKVHRSVKYAVLFTLVTFIGFFVVEHDSTISIHPVQYMVIAFGLCVFYTLLLSLSELMGFALAYGLAAAALVLMVGAYLRAVFGAGTRAIASGGVLAGVYASLYAMLQLQELALLLGSLFLLAVLAALMVLTRRINAPATSPKVGP